MRQKIHFGSLVRTVGAALRGRPSFEFRARAATEGRPYNTCRDIQLSLCIGDVQVGL